MVAVYFCTSRSVLVLSLFDPPVGSTALIAFDGYFLSCAFLHHAWETTLELPGNVQGRVLYLPGRKMM